MITVTEEKSLKDRILYEPTVLAPSVQQYFSSPKTHERLLNDKVRLDAFRRAIHEVVKHGDVVMDIGAGTGILSQYAIEAGAKKVYLIEENSNILHEARRLLAPYSNRVVIQFIDERSTYLKTTDIPERANVVISETIGSLGVNEGIVSTLSDATRFLLPKGTIIPYSLKVYCAPYKLTIKEGLYSRHLLAIVRGLPKQCQLLCKKQLLIQYDVRNNILLTTQAIFNSDMVLPFESKICLWFEACLSPNVIFTNSPLEPETSWGIVISSLVNPYRTNYSESLLKSTTFFEDANLQIRQENDIDKHQQTISLKQIIDRYQTININWQIKSEFKRSHIYCNLEISDA